ncbi:MAG: TetR/AcrR family transcriptional regulator [Acidobacteriota bacterium]|nr:TetR/AcrR family transcriptional regulator [Acidobacteriota bacterium]
MSLQAVSGAVGGRDDGDGAENAGPSARPGTDPRADRFVEAARALVWEAGGPGFTVTQVVAAAGSSLKSFYRCFGSKDELLVALFADDARRGADALARIVRRRPPTDRLRTAVVGLFRFLGDKGRLPYAAALVGEHLRLAQSRPEALTAVLEPFLALFESEMGAAAVRGEIRPGDHRRDARTVFHLVISHLHALVYHQIDDDPAVLSEELWAFCAAALRPATATTEGGRR